MASAGLELGVWVLVDESQGICLADECTHPAMVCLDGIVGKWAIGFFSFVFLEPIVELVDIGEDDIIESEDASE